MTKQIWVPTKIDLNKVPRPEKKSWDFEGGESPIDTPIRFFDGIDKPQQKPIKMSSEKKSDEK